MTEPQEELEQRIAHLEEAMEKVAQILSRDDGDFQEWLQRARARRALRRVKQ